MTLRNAILMLLVVMGPVSAARADSFWDHNGSLVRLVANGSSREFYYAAPRDVLVRAGVRPGTLLFDGEREGDRYFGTARVFSRDCPEPLEYYVEGLVVTETHVVLIGEREVYAGGCRPTGRYRTDRLEFIYKFDE